MQLLYKLCSIDSKSGQEQEIADFIANYVMDKYPDVVVEEDKIGNLYITKGTAETYPVLAAHMDQVQAPCCTKKVVTYTPKGCSDTFCFGWDPVSMKSVGLGFDDKAGLWIALKMLEEFDVIKLAFFVGEEVGCRGSNVCDMTFFDNARFVVQCDRRGNSDFINVASSVELCTEEFINDIDISAYGYSLTNGLITDVKTLKTRGLKVCACNLSCGYYNPHTENECENINDLMKCKTLVEHIIRDCVKVYSHEYKSVSYTKSYKSTKGNSKQNDYVGNYYGSLYPNDYDDYDGEEYDCSQVAYSAALREFIKRKAREYIDREINNNPSLYKFSKEMVSFKYYYSELAIAYNAAWLDRKNAKS